MSEHMDRRIFGTRSDDRMEERRHGSSDYGVKAGGECCKGQERRKDDGESYTDDKE